MSHKWVSLWGCIVIGGCAGNTVHSGEIPAAQEMPVDEPSEGWGHGVGSMPSSGTNIMPGRSGDGSHLSYWGQFWKTPGAPGVTAYDVYDTTVAGQIIMSHYTSSNVATGEQECHWIRDHYDPDGSGYNSYLILENVAGGATPFTYIWAYYSASNPTLDLCIPHDTGGSQRNFATLSDAINDINDSRANETRLNRMGCNNNIAFTSSGFTGEPWIHTSIVGTTTCGDGTTNGSDQCDDGNTSNSDACTSSCKTSTIRSISAGVDHTCAIWNGSTPTLRCWGNNDNGQLGYGDTTDLDGPIATAVNMNGGTPDQVYATNGRTCVLLTSGAMKCFGANSYGQLGMGNTTELHAPSSTAINLGEGVTATKVAAGASHTCALLTGGDVKCWGLNGTYYPLGYDDQTNRTSPDSTALPFGETETVTDIATGDNHVCVILTRGESAGIVRCWGANDDAQLGMPPIPTGYSLPNSTDVNLGGGLTATAIAAGGSTTCVILNTGGVKCWGDSDDGQAGSGSDVSDPSAVSPLSLSISGTFWTQTSAIAVGATHSCASLFGPMNVSPFSYLIQVHCWGNGGSGRLGTGNTTSTATPTNTLLGTTTNFGPQSLTAGNSHTCAPYASTNAVKCWGLNNNNQLGNGKSGNIGDESETILPVIWE